MTATQPKMLGKLLIETVVGNYLADKRIPGAIDRFSLLWSLP
ncbi:MAG: hypothetical protein NT159_18755 [Proteobacteria bacterium]|nr:hypothetical protein [Pseudomonadota bacterium]